MLTLFASSAVKGNGKVGRKESNTFRAALNYLHSYNTLACTVHNVVCVKYHCAEDKYNRALCQLHALANNRVCLRDYKQSDIYTKSSRKVVNLFVCCEKILDYCKR